MVAAAANTTTDDRARRELIKAWPGHQPGHAGCHHGRCRRRAGDAAQLRAVVCPEQTFEQAGPAVDARTDSQVDQVRRGVDLRRQAAVFAAPVTAQRVASDAASELSTLLGGTARVLMAARLADAPQHAAVQALLVQAVELAARMARTLAAQREASAAQQRSRGCHRASAQCAHQPGTAGWLAVHPNGRGSA